MSGITNPAEAYFKDGLWTWDGSVWRKQPLLFGYSETWVYHDGKVNIAGGTDSLTAALVAAGEILVVTHCYAVNDTSPNSSTELQRLHNATTDNIRKLESPVAGEEVTFTGFVILPESYRLRTVFYGCTAGDVLRFSAHGYTMKIAE